MANSYLLEPLVREDYDRIDEVEKHCSSVLSSATDIKSGDNNIYSIRNRFNLIYADWKQETGVKPIMPFDDRELRQMPYRVPMKVVSFRVKDVDHGDRSSTYVRVSGKLLMGIQLDRSFTEEGEVDMQFRIKPSHTEMTAMFQGIYFESKNNGGERVLCMLGNAVLPSREFDNNNNSKDNNPWQWLTGSSWDQNQPPLFQDDQILLVLRSPMTPSLVNRAMKGEMTSLKPKSDPKHFDKVYILSYFRELENYEFGTKKILSEACDPYPYLDSFINDGVDIYRGNEFCKVLHETISGEALNVVPNWKCNGTDTFCRKLGPFVGSKEIEATDGSFDGVKILMQNVICQEMQQKESASSALVAAVFRAVPPSENEYSASWRNVVNNLTVFAEGIWKSTSGQLCMVGCIGFRDYDLNGCDTRICLYIPVSFSMKQRSMISGSFSSINDGSPAYSPLYFEKLVNPIKLRNCVGSPGPRYTYSKIDAAAVLQEKELFNIRTIVSKSLFQFPKLKKADEFLSSLTLLSEDLTFDAPFGSHAICVTTVQIEILSLGPLFGKYFSSSNSPVKHKAKYIDQQQLMVNVSAQISISGTSYNNFSSLFLEGLYDPRVGKMYLVGCRNVGALWKMLFKSADLENGLDCLIEVVVSYPPTMAWRLVNPTTRLSLFSQRNEDDPLHFRAIELQTCPVKYELQRGNILSGRSMEGILRIFFPFIHNNLHFKSIVLHQAQFRFGSFYLACYAKCSRSWMCPSFDHGHRSTF